MLKRTALFLAFGAILLMPLSQGQNSNTGEIKGSVMDPSGAMVPGRGGVHQESADRGRDGHDDE